METLFLVGPDHTQFGHLHRAQLNNIEVALSPGAMADSPSRSFKTAPNEDALLVLSSGSLALLAVADAHFGPESSHELLGRLADRCQNVPVSLGGLSILLAGLSEPSLEYGSETTLTVVVIDRVKRSGFGFAFGDSPVFVVGPERAQCLTRPEPTFLRLDRPLPIELGQRLQFQFDNATLVLCTDGVTECHYRSPSTSIGAPHLHQLRQTHPSLADFVTGLGELALAGVDGNPGGQDNLAIIGIEGIEASVA